MPHTPHNTPFALLILDGWGIAPASDSNPITHTKLPNFDALFRSAAHTRLFAHGEYVGLPKDQDGNSEAGHLNLGAGRVVKQDGVVISESIRDGTFFKNPAFMEAIQHAKRNNSAVHLVGMLSDGQSAHARPEHLEALLEVMHKEDVARVFVHLFADGRDSLTQSGKGLYRSLAKSMHPNQRVASIMGRFYGMDRKKMWDRTKRAYDALVRGKGIPVKDPVEAFDRSYADGFSDEYIKPHIVCEGDVPVGSISDNDSVILFNHRSDRARQLAKVFVQKDFTSANYGAFDPEPRPKNLRFVAMADFGPDLGDIITAYPSKDLEHTLPMVLKGMRQLYVAETEKYAHITYFFNGGYADPVAGEDRVMVPSPNVRTYDESPGMGTEEITATILEAVSSGTHDFIGANIACLDMVAHTGNFAAAQKSLVIVDGALGRMRKALAAAGGTFAVVADHGNIEEMKDLSSGAVDTEHSKNHVPFIIESARLVSRNLAQDGVLSDVAPTVLAQLGIAKPAAMTGNSLFAR